MVLDEGVPATGASLDADGALAAALSLVLFAAELCPGVPFTPAVLLITPLLPESMLLLLLSSTFLQAAVPIAHVTARNAIDR
ncbi:hypothetical protein [Paraburkholderia hospita]|uniref:hypothetical protein n=1 Tax=Paraburkholderia hospita TaxID=169430 RepID=UPI001A97E0C7|nr:hypothetical protein [Paraburkholderia hospita]